jgi:hypothetical protein
VAPTGVAAASATLDTVSFSWSPILYTGDRGGYGSGTGPRRAVPTASAERRRTRPRPPRR